ncbi:MAG: hypothetical protein JXR65_02675 [Bacteroidales bacterium]|nr:hypothetical protein [Bacteroidales bacterium]
MKTKNKKLKKLLYKSFDLELGDQEHKFLTNALATNKKLSEEKEFVSRLRNQLAEHPTTFSTNFEHNLMIKLNESLSLQKIFTIKPTFRAVALSGVAAIIALLISVYFIDGSLSLDSLMGINGYNTDIGILSFF